MFGAKLKQARKAKKLTQDELAELSGFHRNSIIGWETGKRVPRTMDMEKLAKVLEVPAQFFLGTTSELPGETNPALPPHGSVELKKSHGAMGFAYWGGVLDEARRVAERGDSQEIALIAPLLKFASDILATAQKQAALDTSSAQHHDSGVNAKMEVRGGHHNNNNLNVGTSGA